MHGWQVDKPKDVNALPRSMDEFEKIVGFPEEFWTWDMVNR
jgi:hypothetical protein